jgi:hypothetical protein
MPKAILPDLWLKWVIEAVVVQGECYTA